MSRRSNHAAIGICMEMNDRMILSGICSITCDTSYKGIRCTLIKCFLEKFLSERTMDFREFL